VGISKDHDDGTFAFPARIDCLSLDSLLEPHDARLAFIGHPPMSNTNAFTNVVFGLWLARIGRSGKNPYVEPFVI
jgi:hypothetical protein